MMGMRLSNWLDLSYHLMYNRQPSHVGGYRQQAQKDTTMRSIFEENDSVETTTVTARIIAVLVVWLLLPSCGPSPARYIGHEAGVNGSNNNNNTATICENNPGRIVCDGNTAVTCNEQGLEVGRQECAQRCQTDRGCVVCLANERQCQGNDVMVCAADLMHFELSQTCNPSEGEVCDPATKECKNLCELAEEEKATVGCEYIAVDMANYWEGCFVVIVSNVQSEGTARVTVEDEQGSLLDFPGYGTEREVAPRELAVFAVTGSSGQCSLTPARPNGVSISSGIQPGSSFVVRSTLPVVAYQINPYEAANVHTTDASLLLPRPTLGTQYVAVTYNGLSGFHSPASISIVAVEDGTQVTVSPTAALEAGGVVPGTSAPFDVTLNALQHLQVLAQGDLDLTGTLITSSSPVVVFSGGTCSYIPPGMEACDHLEEQLPPVHSWGFTYVAAFPPRRANENTYWRIFAAVDNTQLIFDPISQYNQVLNAGDILELDEPSSFLVNAVTANPDQTEEAPILVANYIKGCAQAGVESGTDCSGLGNLAGDPALVLSVPVEQYLSSYVFMSDPTYSYNYVVVVRTSPTQVIHLDCLDPIPDDKFTIIAQDYARAEVILSSESGPPDGSCTSGSHWIWSDEPFGIWVYGYYMATSYGYPGGMNLAQINDVIIVR